MTNPLSPTANTLSPDSPPLKTITDAELFSKLSVILAQAEPHLAQLNDLLAQAELLYTDAGSYAGRWANGHPERPAVLQDQGDLARKIFHDHQLRKLLGELIVIHSSVHFWLSCEYKQLIHSNTPGADHER